MNKSNLRLRKELISVGAKPAEAKELAGIANQLQLLKQPQSGIIRRSFWHKALPLAATSLAGLTVGIIIVAASQSVMPTSFLYPVQRLSDAVAIEIHPDYRGAVMMKRAQQVKLLVANQAPSQKILATLSDYQSIASEYRTMSPETNVLKFCKTNLTAAANTAQGADKEAIMKVLNNLQDV